MGTSRSSASPLGSVDPSSGKPPSFASWGIRRVIPGCSGRGVGGVQDQTRGHCGVLNDGDPYRPAVATSPLPPSPKSRPRRAGAAERRDREDMAGVEWGGLQGTRVGAGRWGSSVGGAGRTHRGSAARSGSAPGARSRAPGRAPPPSRPSPSGAWRRMAAALGPAPPRSRAREAPPSARLPLRFLRTRRRRRETPSCGAG